MSRQREVPQFINIEDKIAFQLTAKQLGWVGLGCFFGFLAWNFLESTYFFIVSSIIVIFVLTILFIKPYGQTIPELLMNIFIFTFKPRVYIWKKGYQDNPVEEKKPIRKNKKEKNKKSFKKENIKKAIENLDIYE
jgi:hypothetical protein